MSLPETQNIKTYLQRCFWHGYHDNGLHTHYSMSGRAYNEIKFIYFKVHFSQCYYLMLKIIKRTKIVIKYFKMGEYIYLSNPNQAFESKRKE